MPTLGFILSLGLQAYCIYHCYKNKKESYWYFVIFLFSVIGCLVYLLTQVLKKEQVSDAQETLEKIINPGADVQRLKQRLEFSDTHANRMMLAEAYAASGMYEEAAEMYESCRVGLYRDDPEVSMQLMAVYFHLEKFAEVTSLHAYVKGRHEFESSSARLALAKSLERLGKISEAEVEFKAMDRSYSNYEHRYEYALFLRRKGEKDQAQSLLDELKTELSRMSRKEYRIHKKWDAAINRALRDESNPAQGS